MTASTYLVLSNRGSRTRSAKKVAVQRLTDASYKVLFFGGPRTRRRRKISCPGSQSWQHVRGEASQRTTADGQGEGTTGRTTTGDVRSNS